MTQPQAGRVTSRVRPEIQLVAFGDDLMKMFNAQGEVVVTATRSGNNAWSITGPPAPDSTAEDRNAAIDAMNQHVIATRPGHGFSVQVPYGLRETP